MPKIRALNAHAEPDASTGLYDVKRLADLLGVKPATVRTLRLRGELPEPTSPDINGGAVWAKEIVSAFFAPKSEAVVNSTVAPDLPKVVDLFCGCGGMSMGFQLAGFDVLRGYDNWPCAVDTYSANLGHEGQLLDLGDLEHSLQALSEFVGGLEETPGIVGGPPCQDFSSAGKREEGARADLTEKFAEIIKSLEPPFFVMENVARAASAGAYQRALSTMRRHGYRIETIVLDASKCGVPQTRKRLIAFGSQDGEITDGVMHLLKSRQATRSMTLRDWFGDSLGIDHYYRHPRSYARRGIFSIDEPSPTIRGVNRPIPLGYPGHNGDTAPVDVVRPLTTSERAQIQTFPKGYNWIGSKTNIEQMIGNAVPVRLGKFIADAVKDALQSNKD